MDSKEKQGKSAKDCLTENLETAPVARDVDSSESAQGVAWVRALVAVLEESQQVREIEFKWGDVRIRVEKHPLTPAPIVGAAMTAMLDPAAHNHARGTSVSFTNQQGVGNPATPPADHAADHSIRSPMVGTAYLAPNPGEPPFISVGSMISENQTLLIIEAMKTMNHIKAAVSGKVTEILVRNGDPIEFDQVLIRIQKS